MSNFGTVNIHGGNNQFGDFNVQNVGLTGQQVFNILRRAGQNPESAKVIADPDQSTSRRAGVLARVAGVSVSVATGIVVGVGVSAIKQALGLPQS